MKRIRWVTALASIVVTSACASSHGGNATEVSGAVGSAPARTGSPVVHTIALPHYQANLPAGPGRDAFAVSCLSCHSTRYITMQPPLNQAKWEESVRKMVKTYGAPIAEEQVVPIAQYLVAARQADPGAWESLAVTAPADRSEIKLSSSGSADAKRGAALYAQHCASCHGADGRSNTVAAGPLLPRPTDLTSGRYTAEAIAAAVVRGVRGTAMPAFPTLGPEDVRDVSYYTKQLEPHPADGESSGSPDEAKKLYTVNCASCHGPTGAGDGPAAPPLARVPANFHARQPTAERAADVITNGVPGTAMPAWKTKLAEPQRAALAGYIRTFYEPATPR